MAAGNNAPIRPFNKTPAAIDDQNSAGQTLELSSSSNRAIEKTAVAIARVKRQSGINIRVNRNNPTQVARDSPAYIPAFSPKAHAPNLATTQHSRTADSAIGMRAAQSCTPNTRNAAAISQYLSGAFSMYGTPSSLAVIQSPDTIMLREIWAWTASTSSINDGGLNMHPKNITVANVTTMRSRLRALSGS